MRRAFASLTATAVASARALATGSRHAAVDPHDDVARRLLPAPLAQALAAVSGTRTGQALLSPLLLRASLGMVDHIARRSAAIDALLDAALARGVRQVVIVGAGLDGRAHRLPALRDATVYEVDHPASQRSKRERAQGLAITAAALRYVPVDLASEPLAPALTRGGFDAGTPCFVIVEGVVPYLSRVQIDALLAQLRAASAAGSELVLSYIPKDAAWIRRARFLVVPSLRAIGEPLGELPSPDELRALLEAAGFRVERDASPAELLAAAAPHEIAPAEPAMAYERMVHAAVPG